MHAVSCYKGPLYYGTWLYECGFPRSIHGSRSHSGFNILSTHIPIVPCQLDLTFWRYSYFKIWSWKSKVDVISQGPIIAPEYLHCTYFSIHINQPSSSWGMANGMFDREKKSRNFKEKKMAKNVLQNYSKIQSVHNHDKGDILTNFCSYSMTGSYFIMGTRQILYHFDGRLILTQGHHIAQFSVKTDYCRRFML